VLCISCKRGWCTSALLTQDTGAGWCGVMLRCGPVNLSTLYPRADDSPQHMVSVGRSMVRGPAGAIQAFQSVGVIITPVPTALFRHALPRGGTPPAGFSGHKVSSQSWLVGKKLRFGP